MKQNEAKKRSERSKTKNKAKISETNILKLNEGKAASIFLRSETKQNIRKRNKANRKIWKLPP
jgi:hypothetical protein